MRKSIARVAALLAAAAVGGTAVLNASAILPGFGPNVDPSIVASDTLPEEYDQAFRDGMPYGFFVVSSEASYSFGVTKDSEGNVYSASYNNNSVTKIMPDVTGRISLFSQTETYRIRCSALYAITIGNDGNIVFTTNTGSVGIHDVKTGETTTIMRDLTRPNCVITDKENNIYVACENGDIIKYDRKTREKSTVASSLGNLQSIALDSQGVMYALNFGRFSDSPRPGSSGMPGVLYQINPDGTVETVVSGGDMYVWRGRGISIGSDGYVYLTGEGNAWDNGNSAIICKYNPETRTVEKLASGTDYTTYAVYGNDGRIYQNAARDNYVLAYSEKADGLFADQDWSSEGVRVITYGGTFTPSDSGNITITAGRISLNGNISSDSGRVSGWIRIPAGMLPELDGEWDGSNDGHWETPDVTFSGEGMCRTASMAQRIHMRSRGPMIDVYTPAPDFRDNPEAYLIYFDWASDTVKKADAGEFIANDGTGRVLRAYSATFLEVLDFSSSPAYDGQVKRGTDTLDLSKGAAYAVTGSEAISFYFKTENVGSGIAFLSAANGRDGIKITLENSGRTSVTCSSETLFDGLICYDVTDGEWHSFSMQNNFGTVDLAIDGIRIPLEISDPQTIQTEIGVPVTEFSVVGTQGKIYVKENGSVTASQINPQSGEKSFDPLPYVCLGTALLVLAAALTAVFTSKKRESVKK
ncbi:MAG: hypothetical protein J5563_05995 [Clostridia bacterium]|nr:hypothetical protein [Clostridia bacterium]